jgi:TonB-dependent starch-binding outer membrane protein SusC
MEFNLKHTRILLMVLALLVSVVGFSQSRTITGKVMGSDSQEPLIGVSIVIKGTTIGTITDVDGSYTIAAASGQTLVYSFIGYNKQERVVGDATKIDVTLELDTERLGEVVVIGYGQVKKSDATGSVLAITSEDFNKGAITSPQELVVGKIAGVQITTPGGAPGSGATIRIRGGSSLSASNDPLIVIDGVPVDNSGISGMSDPLSTINPNDIETFTVLKDASATAIYGSRASNGVIIITTKKGSKGAKMQIAYNGNISIGMRKNEIDVLNATEFSQLLKDLPTASLASPLAGSANTDWQNEIFQNAIGTDHNVSVSGSMKDIPYRASIAYMNQSGLLKTSSMERITGSLNMNPSFFNNTLKIDASIKGMQINNQFANYGAIGNAIGFDPTQKVKDAASPYGGYFTWTQPNGDPNTVAPANPVAMLEMRKDISTVSRSIGNLKIDYSLPFLKELRATVNMGYDYSNSEGTVDVPENASWMFDKVNGGGEKREYTQEKRNQLLDTYLSYVKDVNSINSAIDAMVGYSWQHFWKEDYSKSTNVAGTKNIDLPTWYPTEYYVLSFFGRVNYTYANKYLATFTIRQDMTSRFSKTDNNRIGIFPAAALAWKIKEEIFLKDVSAINELKLRLGWGVTGQQNIGLGDYPYLAKYNLGLNNAAYQFGNEFVQTLRPDGFDDKIKWEETTTNNIGLDYGLYNNRITGSLDVYLRTTKDLLNVVPVAAGSNFTNELLTNVGDMENRGVEFAINGKIISKKELMWEVGYNITYNKNTITRLTMAKDPSYLGVETGGISGGVGSNIQIHSVDYPKASFFVYEQVYNKDGKPIEGLYVDHNNDGKITADDRYRYKTPDADVFMGLSSKLQYKNFDASIGARINLGNYLYNNVDSRMSVYNEVYWSSGYLRNVTRDIYNTGFNRPQYFSDYYIQNGSFFRIDNISLGYNFNALPNGTKLRVFGTAQNVLVVTPYKGLDPEVSGGIDNDIYPRPLTLLLGVSVQF